MKDRESFIGRAKQVVGNFARRVGLAHPVTTPTEPPLGDAGDKRMWEILNVVPITELNSLTPAEREDFERRSAERFKAEMEFQASLNQTVEEFFGGPKK